MSLPSGLRFHAGKRVASIDALAVAPGEWVVISPESGAVVDDPAPPLARLLATLGSPIEGAVELFGVPLKSLSYAALIETRTKLGFVASRGGLLSNRTISENVGLPLAVHVQLKLDDDATRVPKLLADFDLTAVARKRPDEVDGATRFRACAARALALSPKWIVVEGTGDFEQPGSPTWARLAEYQAESSASVAVCLHSPNARFEDWISSRGGRVLRYRLEPETP